MPFGLLGLDDQHMRTAAATRGGVWIQHQGEDPIPCPIGTHNPLLEQDEQDDCLACPPGYYCYTEVGCGHVLCA